MEQSQTRTRKRPVQTGWIILSCIPFFNWAGFLWLGKTLDHKRWTTRGYIHFVLSTVSSALLMGYATSYHFLNIFENDLEIPFFFLVFASWFVGVIQVWWISGEAKKRLGRQTAAMRANPPAAPAAATPAQRFRSRLIFVLIALIPLSGLCLARMGKTIDNRKLQKQGRRALTWSVLLEVACIVTFAIDSNSRLFLLNGWIPFIVTIEQMLVLLVWVSVILKCATHKKEYVTAYTIATAKEQTRRREEWEQALLQYPCLSDSKWKIKHAFWFLWCLTPFTAPISLIHLAISEKNRKHIVGGLIGLLAADGMFLYYAISGTIAYHNAIACIFTLLLSTWVVVVVCCANLQRSHLLYCAKKCGGYCDAFDAEQAQPQKALDDGLNDTQENAGRD